MGSPARKLPPATLDDLLAKPADERWEIIDGELVQQLVMGPDHGSVILGVGGPIRDTYMRRGGPGGWWFMTDVTVEFSPQHVYRPDILGFRRDRVPMRPREYPVRIRPDWVCEVISPGNPKNDRVKKLNHYHHYGVPHYWILDPQEQTLLVMRWSEPGYITVQTGLRGQRLRAEPFQEVELDMDDIFADGTESPAEPTEG
jgi:Uma2 family endonuclease